MRIFPKHLRQRDFVSLWLSNGFSWQGLWMEVLVLGWLALELTNAPWKVALIGFVRAMPLLLGAFTSVITDRFPRRNLLVVLQLLIIGSIGSLLVLAWLGTLQFWHIVAVSFLNGTVFTLTFYIQWVGIHLGYQQKMPLVKIIFILKIGLKKI